MTMKEELEKAAKELLECSKIMDTNPKEGMFLVGYVYKRIKFLAYSDRAHPNFTNTAFQDLAKPAVDMLFGFGAWLTSRKEAVIFSSKHDASKMADLLEEFCKVNHLGSCTGNYPENFIMPIETEKEPCDVGDFIIDKVYKVKDSVIYDDKLWCFIGKQWPTHHNGLATTFHTQERSIGIFPSKRNGWRVM